MKRYLFRTLITAAAAALLLILALGQTQAPQVPFFTTPSLSAFSSSSGITLLVRQPDNKYAQLRFGITAPYGMLSSLDSLAGIISGSTKFSLGTSPGPANAGLASQYIAIGDFKGDGSPGVAYVDVGRNRNKITVYLGTPVFVYSGSASYTVGTETAGVIAADFNRDGKTDLAVVYAGNSTTPGGVAILLNKGDGTFAAAVSYAAGASPVSVAALDLNRDGFLDLAVADGAAYTGAGKVFVLLGRSDGTFGAAASYPAGQKPLSVTIADFSGDGNPDLAVTAADNSLSILLGNGNGTFRASSSSTTGSNSQYVAAGDFNRDGKMDLVVANSWNQSVTIFLGQGDGSFQAGLTYCASYHPESLIITDYNGDGNLDIIQGSGDARGIGPGVDSEDIDILLGNGNGTFQGATSRTVPGGLLTGTFFATGDFSGDGKLDAILNDKFGGNLYLFSGDGKGGFQAPVTLNALATGGSQTGPSGAVAGDFNGDGRLDLAVTEQLAGKVAVLQNSATGLQLSGTFPSGGAVPGPIVAADFNGDGKLDLAVVNAPSDDRSTAGNLAVFFGGGNGAFQFARTYSAGSLPSSIAVADLNGDGKPDLIVTDQSDPFVTPRVDGSVYVFLNDGNAGFKTPTKLASGTYPYSVYAGDLNGDGKPDLVVASSDSHAVYKLAVLPGNGNGSFQAAASVSSQFGPSGVLIRDFNGDGTVDLVVSHCCGATDMTYLQGNGDGTFQTEAHFNGGANPFAVAASDLNGDGKLDLIVGGTQLLSVTALLNNAATLATPQITLAGIGNAANYVSGKVSPGELAVIFGKDFGPAAIAGLQLANGMVTTEIGETRVFFDGVAAPMVYAASGQISCVVPYEVSGKTTTQVVVEYKKVKGTAVAVPVVEAVPGLFSINSSGTGPGAFLNEDNSVNTAANPLERGKIAVFYGTGEGQTTPAGVSGLPATTVFPKPLLPVTVTIGGKSAEVLYYGAAPYMVAGVIQINARVPTGIATGAVEVVFKVGNNASQTGITLAVK